MGVKRLRQDIDDGGVARWFEDGQIGTRLVGMKCELELEAYISIVSSTKGQHNT
jgi:hypothetical protein